jgi:hypothetical protein
VSTVLDFTEQLTWSNGVAPDGVERILRDRIPGCVAVRRASVQEDRHGTDYWAVRIEPLRPLSVDLKARRTDWAPRGADDLALETWSVIGERAGWTRDRSKQTDFILWYWDDTRRFCLVPFHALCRVFRSCWQEWSGTYRTERQDSGGWQSECVFVPRVVVQDSITRWQNGIVP